MQKVGFRTIAFLYVLYFYSDNIERHKSIFHKALKDGIIAFCYFLLFI